MTSSEDVASTWSVVQAVLEALDEGRIRREIDERVDLAAFSFKTPHEQTRTQKEFLATVGEFVKHIYTHALAVPQNLTPDQARAEAVQLLERSYLGMNASAYDAALLDALDPGGSGVWFVLASLEEIIKERERAKYVHWVLAHLVDSLDWNTRCRLTRFLLDHLQSVLPVRVRRYPPAQLAHACVSLLLDHRNTDKTLASICGDGSRAKEDSVLGSDDIAWNRRVLSAARETDDSRGW